MATAITATTFKARYTEFSTTPDVLVDATIAEQDLRVSDSWGTRREDVLSLYVADALSRNPKARNARISVESGNVALENPYGAELKRLRLAHGWLRSRT